MATQVNDIHWLAGFLDGEGCFYFNRNACRVQVVHKDKWPLLRMQEIVGGTIRRVKNSLNGRMYYALFIVGKRAAGVMMTVYSLMSPRRQEKIAANLAKWRVVQNRGACNTKTHCIRGHEFTPENCYKKPGTNGRECKACIKVHHENHKLKVSSIPNEARVLSPALKE